MTEQGSNRFVTRLQRAALVVLPAVAFALWLYTRRHPERMEPFFMASDYYNLLAGVAIYVAIFLRTLSFKPQAWLKEHWRGLLTCALVAGVVLSAVPPAMRVLSDEANLAGVSKNLYYHHTANFAVAGKWYYENYQDTQVIADRRPALFPFLVHILHVVNGYGVENAFRFNAILFVAFLWCTYRLTKRLGGEVFALSAVVLVSASPNTLVAVRSAGFDFMATFFVLLILKSFEEFLRERTPTRFALYVLNLCMFAHVRYEGWALTLVGLAVPLALRLVKRRELAGYGWLYAAMPLFLLPRYWQALAKAKDAEQPLSASLFTVKDFIQNWADYLSLLRTPLATDLAHSPLIIALGLAGSVLGLVALWRTFRAHGLRDRLEFAVLALAALGLLTAINFSYNWGKPLHAAAVRLFVWLDTYLAIAAAFFIEVVARRLPLEFRGRRSVAPAALIASSALFLMNVPSAAAGRFINALVLTREAAQTWHYFERVGDKRIFILCDRPGLFTIMNYGAGYISNADNDRSPLYELSRKLYQDVYLIQEIDANTNRPLPDFDVWRDVEMDTMQEFQNGDSSYMRISRVRKAALK